MKILIYGTGGIGGFLGAFLLQSIHKVTFLARGKTFKKFSESGITLKSKIKNITEKKINLFDELKDCPEIDIVILAVKLYDLNFALDDLKQNGKGDFIILPFQNGVVAEDLISQKFGNGKVFGGVAQISSFLNTNKEIIHNGKLASFFIGEISANLKYIDIVKKFCESIKYLGIDFRYSKKIKQKIWDKFIFLSAYSGVTTLTSMTIGQIFNDKESKGLFVQAMKETYNLAQKLKIRFDYNPVEVWSERILKMPKNSSSSMFLDFKNCKHLELDWLSGSVVKMCSEHCIGYDAHQKIVTGIKSK